MNIKQIFTLIVTVTLISALSACSSEDTGEAVSGNTGGGYPAEVTRESLEACEATGASAEMCACITEKMQEAISYAEIKEIEAKMANGEQPPAEYVSKSTAVGLECMGQG